MKVLVTGGCGFIGSNFIRYLLTDKEAGSDVQVLNLDNMTYAGRGRNIPHMRLCSDVRYRFERGDIADRDLVKRVFDSFQPDSVVNFAAESHVDNSLVDKSPFEKTNVEGAAVMASEALKQEVKRFVQISTDEVYGSREEGSFSESSSLNPSNPYSQTKARAEGRVMDCVVEGLHIIITRSANNYGQYQHPEKFLPRSITRLIRGKNIPLMYSQENPGLNVRDWLHVGDNCRAIWHVAGHGIPGQVYNIPGNNERTNIEMAQMLLETFGFGEDRIDFITHRKGHDFRYSISGDKLEGSGFVYKHKDLKAEIRSLVEWYKENRSWWEPLVSEADK